ncbi:tetratricopeptide repeat protein [Streptomyces parvus]|uniref:tetratricopeptide repeat protein n=1 Tax=Streptomyces parvus TaxID=66428 RepID=UPI003D73AF9A
MDATDLGYQARTRSGCIPPELVSRLVKRGHLDVVELQAGRGEWFCALAWARLLGERGRQIDALEVLAPYTATGWWTAAVAATELLEEHGDVEGAIAAYRGTDGPVAWNPNSAYQLAQLLTRHGQGDEAIAVMRAQADAHPGDDWIFHALSQLCLDQGRPADGLAHLHALTANRGVEVDWELFWMRLPLIAACSGVDEAVERARAHPEGTTWYAAEHIARLLADAGRTEEAIAVLQQHDRRNSHNLAGYLIDLGRIGEALAILQQPGPHTPAVPTTDSWSEDPPF